MASSGWGRSPASCAGTVIARAPTSPGSDTGGNLPDSYVRRCSSTERARCGSAPSPAASRASTRRTTGLPPAGPQGLIGKDITALARRQPSGFWIASNRGLAWLESGKRQDHARAGAPGDGRHPVPAGHARRIPLDRQRSTVSGRDLPAADRSPRCRSFRCGGGGRVSVLRLLEDRTGRLWVGSRLQGTFIVAPGARPLHACRAATPRPVTPSTPWPMPAMATSGRNLWRQHGPDRSRQRCGHRERHDPLRTSSLLDDDVGALMKDRDGRVWIASAFGLSTYDTRFDGVATLEGGSGRLVRNPNVPAVLAGADGAVFLAAELNGLQILPPGGGAPTPPGARSCATGNVLAPGTRHLADARRRRRGVGRHPGRPVRHLGGWRPCSANRRPRARHIGRRLDDRRRRVDAVGRRLRRTLGAGHLRSCEREDTAPLRR